MQRQNEQLNRLLAPVAEGMGYEWVGLDILSAPNGSLLRMYIDKPDGVTIDNCVEVAEQLIAVLTVEGLNERYRVEVSSPGLDRPLFTEQHWHKAKGAEVKVKLHYPILERRALTGLIRDVSENGVVIIVGSEDVEVPFDAVAKANLIPEISFKRSKKRQ